MIDSTGVRHSPRALLFPRGKRGQKFDSRQDAPQQRALAIRDGNRPADREYAPPPTARRPNRENQTRQMQGHARELQLLPKQGRKREHRHRKEHRQSRPDSPFPRDLREPQKTRRRTDRQQTVSRQSEILRQEIEAGRKYRQRCGPRFQPVVRPRPPTLQCFDHRSQIPEIVVPNSHDPGQGPKQQAAISHGANGDDKPQRSTHVLIGKAELAGLTFIEVAGAFECHPGLKATSRHRGGVGSQHTVARQRIRDLPGFN